jgi:hypothetical protein
MATRAIIVASLVRRRPSIGYDHMRFRPRHQDEIYEICDRKQPLLAKNVIGGARHNRNGFPGAINLSGLEHLGH